MAKEAVPDNPYMSDTLGWVYYRKNIYSRAIVYLKEAAEKLPNQATVHYHLGMAYYKNGQVEQAKKELSRALQIDPNFPGAAEAKENTIKKGEPSGRKRQNLMEGVGEPSGPQPSLNIKLSSISIGWGRMATHPSPAVKF